MKDMPASVNDAVAATARRLEAVEAVHKRLQAGRNAENLLLQQLLHTVRQVWRIVSTA